MLENIYSISPMSCGRGKPHSIIATDRIPPDVQITWIMKHPADLQKALIYRWFIFGILAVGYILVYFHRLSPSIVAEELRKAFQTTGATLGLLGSAYFYPYAAMQLPAGLLSDSLGPRKIIAIFLLIACVGSVIFGLSPNVSTAILGRGLVGVGISMLFVPSLKVLAEWFGQKEYALAVGILMATGGVGVLSAATPLAFLNEWFGWRRAFWLVSILTLAVAILVWAFVRNRPEDKGFPPLARMDGTVRQSMKIGLWQGMKQIIRSKYFWSGAIWFFFQGTIFFGFGGMWAGPFLMHVYKLDEIQAGNILNMLAVAMIVGSPILTWLSNDVFKGRKKILIVNTAFLVLTIFVLAAFTADLNIPLLYVIIFFISLCSSAIVGVTFTSIKELFPKEIAGTSTGAVNLFPFTGGALAQPFFGYVLEHAGKVGNKFKPAGYRAVFVFMLFAAIIAFIATFFMKETIEVEENTAPSG